MLKSQQLLVVDSKELMLLRTCVRFAIRPQVLYLATPPSQALPWPLISLHRFFADRFPAEVTMTRKGLLLHQIYCPTLHLRLLLAALDTPKVDPHGASNYSVSRGISVSCAQMCSEHRFYCVSDGTHCSADVCCVRFPGSGGHTFPRVDADRDLAKRQLAQRFYDEILHVRSRLDDPPGARGSD